MSQNLTTVDQMVQLRVDVLSNNINIERIDAILSGLRDSLDICILDKRKLAPDYVWLPPPLVHWSSERAPSSQTHLGAISELHRWKKSLRKMALDLFNLLRWPNYNSSPSLQWAQKGHLPSHANRRQSDVTRRRRSMVTRLSTMIRRVESAVRPFIIESIR